MSRPGEIVLRCGQQTRSFVFGFEQRIKVQEEFGCTPFEALRRGTAPENFNAKMGYYAYSGKKDKKFTLLTVAGWFDGEKRLAGQEIGQGELAVEFLYAFSRSKTGQEAEEEIEAIEETFGHLLVSKGNEDHPSEDG